MHTHKFSILTTIPLLLSGCIHADLVLTNGTIVTMDDHFGEVQAVAVRGDRIVAVGDNMTIGQYIDRRTKVIDLGGRLAIPGLIDSHAHFTGIGEAALKLNLMHTQSWDEVIAMVKDAVANAAPGDWIVGRGWHQEKWRTPPIPQVEGFPTHQALSAISPDNPVYLTHASGHACFVNFKAMELAGIDASTPDPPGGEILKDASGEPIGVFRETAQDLVGRVANQQTERTPEQQRAYTRRVIQLADKECLSKGITTLEDAGSSFDTIDTMREMANNGELGVRLWVMIREPNALLRKKIGRYKIIGAGRNHLTVRAIKDYMDGALGSRGAWLLEPYSDSPESTGLNVSSVEDITETARIAKAHGFQLCVHAIGDRANREVLNIFEELAGPDPDGKLRWRIEHAQHLHPNDIPRFGQLGVIAAMQGIHCTSDGPFVVARLGYKRAQEGAYAWRKLIDTGAVVSNGTDAPVEDVDPIPCFYATVSRMMNNGQRFFPEERLTRHEALRTYTVNAAYAAFEEKIKGSLTPGKLADIVVLSKNILRCPEDKIPDTRVLYTIVGGKIRFENTGS